MDVVPVFPPAVPLSGSTSSVIETALAGHVRRAVDMPDRRQAAVLLLLFERGGEPWVVLTRRTETVRSHKGEISFPGGAKDPEDADLWATAVRESAEELGVSSGQIRMLGALDDYPTFSTGYIVSAFVAALTPGGYSPSEHEIAEVIEVPLGALARNGRVEVWEREGIRYPMHIFEVDGHYVWGVTAFILRRFLDILGDGVARPDPVAVVRDLAASDPRFNWVGIYWVEGPDLVVGPYIGEPPLGHERIRIPEGVCGAVAAAGETEVVPDVRRRPGHIACDIATRSEVVVPIFRGGSVIGVLDVDSNTIDAFAGAEIAMVEAAARRVGGG